MFIIGTPHSRKPPLSTPRFLVETLPATGNVTLNEAEARHASNVLRLRAGDTVELFDGQGAEAEALIEQIGKRNLTIAIQRRTDVDRELANGIELIVALPKGDRQKTLIDALVQLGVAKLTPLECQRGVAQPSENALQRLERGVIEASKQCGRNRLMEIHQPQSVDEVARTQLTPKPSLRLFAHPYGESHTLSSPALSASDLVQAQVVIGPEGGFSDEECDGFRRHGWQQLSLGRRILRIEVAAMKVAAWWAARQE